MRCKGLKIRNRVKLLSSSESWGFNISRLEVKLVKL